ncbi:F-box/kelch-repeat protein At3g06240-like isoform X2 [Apium graveolens]|uniref:F-box/kelch-repeat protein At3g06240-like isoform X2 n=1 Tax=Apium graveolens TaxID=4045 RepID=UPI003D79F8A2
MSTTSFDDLPEGTVVEILLKLGVKDLIRSTSVSKTWRHRLLASSCFRKLLDDRNRSMGIVGMGFDKLTNDYKIVRIVFVKDDKKKLFGEVAPKVEIYSLRKNTWTKLKDPGVQRLVYDHGIYFNGCYYWLELNQPGTERANGCYGTKMRIMSFDFHTELFGLLKVPNDVPCNLGRCPHKLMEVEDSLALCVIDAPHRDKGDTRFPFCIWLMRQENGVVTWTLRFRPLLQYFGSPLGITKNGTLIIESYRTNKLDETCIVSCNLKSMIHKVHGFGIIRNPRTFLDISTLDASFPESLIMYEGGKLLLKCAK